MAQKQKPKPEPESEWVDIPDPTITDNEWEEIPDPTQSTSAPFEEQGPPAPQQISEPTDWLGGFSKSVLGGEALHASDESARGWLQGAILDLPHGLYEGGKMLATTNPIGYAAYHMAGKKMPAEEMGENLIPSLKNVWHLGEESGAHPYEFGRALGQMTGQPAMTEGLFGNVPGLPSGVDIARGAGKGVEFAGRVMKDYSPLTDVGTRTLAGAAGYKYGGFPAAVLGAKYGGAPKILKGLESAFGGKLERGGQWMQNVGKQPDWFHADYPDSLPDGPPQEPDWFKSDQPEPTPSGPPPENVWFESEYPESLPDNPPVEPNWFKSDQPEPTPSGEPDWFEAEYPESLPDDPNAPKSNVGTGSAFEKYMQAKAKAAREAGKVLTGDEAPMLDIEGNEIPPEVSDVAKSAGASINPDMEIKWPKKPTASELSKMQKAGFQFDSATNIFRKFKKAVTEGLENFGSNEAGTFTPGEMFDNLKKLLGRDPSDAELGAAVRRQVQPGEPTGAVAPFLTAEQRAQRLDDLANPANPENQPSPQLPRFMQEDPQFAPSIPEASGDISTLRSQSVMDSPRTMDPRMAARVEAGGPREFDFTKPNPDAEIKKFLDSEDTQIADYLKSEDAHPPEATDLNAWKKLKDLGKRLLGDESGEFDPNTLWWNLRRYFDRAPTEAELTRGMEIDPEFKMGARAQEVKNEIANKPWADHVLDATKGFNSEATQELLRRLGGDVKKPYEPPARGLGDAAEDLHDAYVWGSERSSIEKRIAEVKQFISDATDVETAKKNRDDLGTIADNSDNAGKAALDALYDIADAHYRKLRNPGLESSKPNRAKPIEDAFPGEIQAVRGEDVAREHMTKAKELINDGHVTEAREIISDITKKLTPRLADKITKEWQKFENEFFGDSEDKFGPKADIPPTDKWDAAITDDPDRTPSKLPPGHVDIEGTRHVDLNQAIKSSKSELPKDSAFNDMVGYKADWVNEVLSGLDKLRQSHDVGIDNALSRLKTDLKIKNPSRAQINEMVSNLNKLAKHPDAPKDTWLDLKDSGGITEEDLNNYFKKGGSK